MDKKATFDYNEYWAEIFFFSLFLIGLILSFTSGSLFLNYLIIILMGFLSARALYKRKTKTAPFPLFMIVIGFLAGYLLGARFGNRIYLLSWFVVVFILSYILHAKGQI